MKKIAAIGLLVLLLYNTFGLSFAIFFFENDFKVATPASPDDDWKIVKLYLPSLPYTDNWESSEVTEGLLQSDGNFYNTTHVQHKNDTLYVTLKTNQVARDQFFELANMMERVTDNGKNIPESAQNKALKLLDNFLKNYIPNSHSVDLVHISFESNTVRTYQLPVKSIFSCCEINLSTPPPEFA